MHQHEFLSLNVSDEFVATLSLARPDKQNALSFEMWAALPELLAHALGQGCRALVVVGEGAHFCSGADIDSLGASLNDVGVEDGYRAMNDRAELALATFPRPTIAAIRGNCIGGGCQLALACDLRISDTSARFGITPAKLGVLYPSLSIERTAQLVGVSAAKRLLFTGDTIDATEALRLGLIDYLVDSDAFENSLRKLVATVASRSLLTQLHVKEVLAQETTSSPSQLTERWKRFLADANDLDEGLAAYKEKRTPLFTWTPEST
jgi:enoyl-CoA hydratase/carnithine racemase